MTAILSVHIVREHIRQAVTEREEGGNRSSTPMVGRIFHEVAADLLGDDHAKNVFSFLERLDFDRDVWTSHLIHFIYDMHLGPRLAKEQARLQEQSEGVLHLWKALQALSGWLIDLAWTARTPRGRRKSLSWQDLQLAIKAEVPLEAEFHEPGWSEPVLLTGVADSLLRAPSGNWCVQEYKTGYSSPEADLSQVCLYHLILTRKGARKPRRSSLNRSLALLSFQPELKERVFSESEIQPVQEKLLSLIGRLARVVGEEYRPLQFDPPASGMTAGSMPSVNGKAAASPPAGEKAPASGSALKNSENAMDELGRKLVRVFDEYRRPVELVGEPVPGPAFYRFAVNLGRGVKLDQIQRLAREVQVRLGLRKPPFIGVDRGRVVVDMERPDRHTVRFEEVKHLLVPGDPLFGSSLIPVGLDLESNLHMADLGSPLHAHLLVAGTTGSGKTEWLRTAIHCLVRTNTPDTLRFILIDPKRVAFLEFRDSPFLLTPDSLVFPDGKPSSEVLAEMVGEMERRYDMFRGAGVDDLAGFVKTSGRPLPRIVCVCDEYYALVTGDNKRRREIETRITLLGAKARAAGIHLILATQQPSRETIRGALDSNIPGRIGLMMVKGEESRMLLGQNGAENLLGKGDLFFRDVGEPLRLQAILV